MHKAEGLLCSSTDRARNVSAYERVRLPPEHRVVAELQPVRYPERLCAIGGAVDYRESDSKGFAVQHLMHAGQLPEVITRKHALCRSHGATPVSKTSGLGPTPSRRAIQHLPGGLSDSFLTPDNPTSTTEASMDEYEKDARIVQLETRVSNLEDQVTLALAAANQAQVTANSALNQ